ncbi:MAG: hypothetical protein Ta2A_14310 [Treponemataceae bacterium]|nr:MAG: hypothetical protein Ta2A_14310 [Treponemataceae bacterium]
MSEKLTFAELMAGFAEIRESQRETEKQMRKTDAKIAELAEESKKTDAQMRETEKQMRETEKQMRETDAKLAEFAAERRKADKKLDKRIKAVTENLGGMSNSNGLMTEEYFANSLKTKMTFGKMHFDTIARNVNLVRGELEDEFDIVMYNGNSVALIEAKYKAREDDLQTLVTSKIENFRILFPSYANYAIYLGLASMSFDDNTITKAKKLGVAILRQNGQSIEINTENIRAY